jgi:AraC-like DNA-binding protein
MVKGDLSRGGLVQGMVSELAEALSRVATADGLHALPIPGVSCIKISRPYPRGKQHWRGSLCIVAQGCKEIILGRAIHRCDAGQYIAAPVDLPVTSRVSSATPAKPFLCLKMDFDSAALSEVAAQIENSLPRVAENPMRALFIGKSSERMLDAVLRLAKLLRNAEDARVLGPLLIKEMYFHLLKGSDGPAIRQFLRSGSTMHRISQAIYSLKAQLSEEVDVMSLAKAANMSRSAFFHHFKAATAMSPIQFQKRLRLLEARRLMIDEGEKAEGSAYKVGYNSASQFSREYSRMFGNSPLRDAMKLKQDSGSLLDLIG